jgi:uncharacterized protein involved in exopolysaccharide biosynthesis
VSFQGRANFDYREILRVLARRRLLIVLPALVTIVAAVVGVALVQPEYSSTATLAYEGSVGLTRTVAEAASPSDHRNDRVRLMRRRIESSSFLEAVAVQIGLHQDPQVIAYAKAKAAENPGYDENDLLLRRCVELLQRMIDIQTEGSNIFHITAVSTDPWRAQAVASTAAEQYLQTTRQVRIQQSDEAHVFALEQMAIYEQKVEEKRKEIRQYEEKAALHPINSSPVSEENVSRVNTLITAADADIEFVRDRLDGIQAQINDAGLQPFVDLGVIKSSKLDALRETLMEGEKHLARTLVGYKEDEPAVTTAKTQLAVKSQQLLSEIEALVDSAFPSIVPEYRQLLVDFEYNTISLEATKGRHDELQHFIDEYAKDLSSLPEKEFHLSRLQEELASAEHLYQTWLEQGNSTQIAKAVQSADVGSPVILLEPARVPLRPFAPDRNRIMVLAILMGIALGLGTAVAAEYFDLTLKSPEQIEAVLGVAILGTVPRMQAAVLLEMEAVRGRRMRFLVISVALTALALAAAGYWYFIVQKGAVG